MPKYICLCENPINLSYIPSPNQLLLIEDVDYDFDTTDVQKLYEEMILVVRCNVCKRLYIFENGYDNHPIIYKPEDGSWNKDMR